MFNHVVIVSADKVTHGLTDLMKQATPGTVSSVQAVRRAMGITPQPHQSEASETASQSADSLISQSNQGSVAVNLDAMATEFDRDLQDFFEQAATDSDTALQQGCDSPLVRMDGEGDSVAGGDKMEDDEDIITIEDSN